MATRQHKHPLQNSTYAAASPARRLSGGGTAGNERLTATTGAILLILLAVIGVTILRLQPLLSEHLFVGMMLIPPVLLKMGSTGYRFVRYYTADPIYRRKGPPAAPLRIIAPMVIASTVAVLGTGVILLFAGPSARGTWLPLHKASFFVWLAFAGVHVLGHLAELPRALRGDYARSSRLSAEVTGRSGRTLALAGALIAGAVLAILVIPEFGAWLNGSNLFHHHG